MPLLCGKKNNQKKINHILEGYLVVCISFGQMENNVLEEVIPVSLPKSQPRRSMGLGYILEDARWLDNELEQ